MSRKKKSGIYNSHALLSNYAHNKVTLTLYLKGNYKFTGTIGWFDDYALKIKLRTGEGNITIPIHNIIYYECDYYQREIQFNRIVEWVYRNVPKSTLREETQLSRYKKTKELLHFYLEDGTEIRGRIQWYIQSLYCIRPENGDMDHLIIKRHILYYKELRADVDKAVV